MVKVMYTTQPKITLQMLQSLMSAVKEEVIMHFFLLFYWCAPKDRCVTYVYFFRFLKIFLGRSQIMRWEYQVIAKSASVLKCNHGIKPVTLITRLLSLAKILEFSLTFYWFYFYWFSCTAGMRDGSGDANEDPVEVEGKVRKSKRGTTTNKQKRGNGDSVPETLPKKRKTRGSRPQWLREWGPQTLAPSHILPTSYSPIWQWNIT